MIKFNIKEACLGVVALDVLGILLNWKVFDHFAHLGGMLLGYLYIKYGYESIWRRRYHFKSKLNSLIRKINK